MSYGLARRIDDPNEPLYRAVITITSGHGDNRVKYVGPYTTAGPAKAAITREQKWWRHHKDVDVTGHVEYCQPTWEPMP